MTVSLLVKLRTFSKIFFAINRYDHHEFICERSEKFEKYPFLFVKHLPFILNENEFIGKMLLILLENNNRDKLFAISRNREKCVQARRDIVLATRNKQVYCRQCDLEDFDSIRQFVQKMCHGWNVAYRRKTNKCTHFRQIRVGSN